MNIARLLILLICCNASVAQRVTVSGYVTDRTSGEALIGATVYDTRQNSGTTTNRSGYFSLSVNPRTSVRFSYVGYESIVLDIVSLRDTVVQVNLLPNITEIAPVSVSATYQSATWSDSHTN